MIDLSHSISKLHDPQMLTLNYKHICLLGLCITKSQGLTNPIIVIMADHHSDHNSHRQSKLKLVKAILECIYQNG